jgi:outer membrane receptor protein involved in Fe transport
MLNNKLAKAVRLAIAFGGASAALFGANANAAEEQAAEEVERIQVTGSRIKRTDMETASPITVISAEVLKAQGIQDVGQFLQTSAIMSGSPAMTTTNNGGNGGTFVELRGLGSARTLVLVNGRRPVSSDFQGIPASMIERIEVLKDGASATYGADAVAGVVNIITRRDFEGVELTLQTAGSFDVSANDQNGFSLVAGKNFDDGHFVVGVDYVKQEAVYQGDVDKVDYFQFPWQVWGTAEEESFRQNGLIGTGDDANVIVVGSGSVPCGNFYLQHGPTQTNGLCDGGIPELGDMRDFVSGGPNNDTYNYAPVNYLQTPYTKLNIFLDGSFELNDSTTVYAETRINKRESRQELAAVPYDTRNDPGYVGMYGVTEEDGTPVLDDNGEQVMREFNGVSKDNYYNPFGEDVLRSRRRMLEGGRSFEQDISRFQQVIGVEGDIGDSWYYDVNYNYGYSQTVSTDFGQLYGPNLAKAMGPSHQGANGNIVCGTEESPISGCVPLNVFGGPGSVTQEMLDYVTSPLVDSSNYTLQTLTGFVGGDLFELPAGMVAGGFGYEYRSEKLESQVDSGKFMGEVTGNKSKGTNGDFDVNSLFTEIRIPLVEGLPFAESIELPVGVRYDDFSAFGGSTTYQLGFEWNTGVDLLLRGTYGTVFRAPSIGNLYGPGGDSFPSATDPCRSANWDTLTAEQQGFCQADGVAAGGTNNDDAQQRSTVGGNPDLQPEEGDTYTVGLAWSPEFVDGLGITLDYWSIELEGVIDSVGAADSLAGCYYGGIAELCTNVSRDQDGEIDDINEGAANLSRMTAKGIDFEASYAIDALGGSFNTIFSWTHFLERENQVYSSNTFLFEMEDLNGRFENDTSYATDKMNLNLTYTFKDLSVNYAMNYISDLEYDDLLYWGTTPVNAEDPNSPNAQYKVDAIMYHDLSATYFLNTGTTVSAGITNLTDELPPYIEPAFNGNTDESNYRLFGRSWYLRLVQTF